MERKKLDEKYLLKYGNNYWENPEFIKRKKEGTLSKPLYCKVDGSGGIYYTDKRPFGWRGKSC